MGTGASDTAVAAAAERREVVGKKKGMTKEETAARKGARATKSRAYDD